MSQHGSVFINWSCLFFTFSLFCFDNLRAFSLLTFLTWSSSLCPMIIDAVCEKFHFNAVFGHCCDLKSLQNNFRFLSLARCSSNLLVFFLFLFEIKTHVENERTIAIKMGEKNFIILKDFNTAQQKKFALMSFHCQRYLSTGFFWYKKNKSHFRVLTRVFGV